MDREGRRDDWLELVFTHNYFVPTTTVMRAEVWGARRTRRWPETTVGDVVLWYDAALDGTPLYWIAARSPTTGATRVRSARTSRLAPGRCW